MASNKITTLAELKERAKLEAEINSGLKGYLAGVEKVKSLTEDIKTAKSVESQLQAEIQALVGATTEEEKKQLKTKEAALKLLKEETKELEAYRNKLVVIGKEASRLKMTMGQITVSGLKGLTKGIANLPKTIMGATSQLKDLFEMDKAIKTSALQMGILSKQSTGFRDNLKSAAMDTAALGVGIKDLAEMQAQYSENLGRNVVMSKESLKAMAAMSKATGLGAEGTAQMAADMDNQGLSAEKTKQFVEQAMDDSHAMGLNSSKVVKNISQNIKMLNKYRFKDGIKGLAQMAMTASKLGVDMNFAGGMADKLFDVEGAIDMSAQLQVMGGAWAKMADPFHLMYMARNDMKGLTEEIGEAAKASVSFAKDGSIEMSAMEMHRLKKVAEQTGLEYDKLVDAGKNAFKLGQIKMQAVGLDPKLQEFVANTAEFKDGKATIMIGQDKKMVSQLTAGDKTLLESQMKEKKTMEDRAKDAQTFDEKLTNLINLVKTAFLPIVEGINKVLGPMLDNLMGEKGKKFREDLFNLGVKIGNFVEGAAKIVKGVAEFLGPTSIFGLWIAGKVGMFIFDKLKWIQNGFDLAKGFQAGNRGGSFLSSLFGKGKGKGGTGGAATTVEGELAEDAAKTGAKGIGKFAKFGGGALAGGLTGVIDGVGSFSEGKTGKGIGNIAGGVIGGALGTLLDPFIGPLGTMLGAKLGSWAGGAIGEMFSDKGTNDGIFGGMGTGAMIGGAAGSLLGPLGMMAGSALGSQFDQGRGVLQDGKIHPIDNKDDLIAMKRGGAIDKAGSKGGGSSTMTIQFAPLNINGIIKLDIPGTPGIGLDLAKNPQFRRDITTMVHSELEKNINGGKNKG